MLRCCAGLVAVFLILAPGSLTSSAVDSTRTPTSHTNYMERQAASILLVPSSTSSFNWWPYPPGGISTSTSTSAVPTTTLTSLESSSTDVSSPATSSNSITDSNTSTTANNTSITSLSIVHITALPPANSTSTFTTPQKLKKPSSFRVVYLIPVFAVLGVILGSATAWLCYGCIRTRRGPRKRVDSLEPGPAYQSSPTGEDWTYDEKDESAALHGDEGSPSKHSRHGSVYSRPSSGRSSWFGRAISLRLQGDRTFGWPDTSKTPGCEETNPFLAVPSTTRGLSTRTKASTDESIYPSSGVLSMEDGEDVDLVPYESLRRKSTRRDILERLNSGTSQASEVSKPSVCGKEVGLKGAVLNVTHPSKGLSFRRASRGHRRADSDFQVVEPSRPARTHSSDDSPRKERGVVRQIGTGVDETEWVEGSGFRIVEEHLDRMRDEIKGGDWGEEMRTNTGLQSQPQTPKRERGGPVLPSDDKYTVLPIRKSPSKRSPCVTPTSTYKRTRSAASFLPLSPPQIMSPPLEDILFFQSPSQKSLRTNRTAKPQMARNTTTTARTTKKVNKLHSSTPQLLFSAADGASPHDSQAHTHGREKDLPFTPPRSSTAEIPPSSQRRILPSALSSRGTAAERFNARHGALSKVDQIVSRSWSQRDLSEVERVRSPTMFGARVDSVQDRLAALEGR